LNPAPFGQSASLSESVSVSESQSPINIHEGLEQVKENKTFELKVDGFDGGGDYLKEFKKKL